MDALLTSIATALAETPMSNDLRSELVTKFLPEMSEGEKEEFLITAFDGSPELSGFEV